MSARERLAGTVQWMGADSHTLLDALKAAGPAGLTDVEIRKLVPGAKSVRERICKLRARLRRDYQDIERRSMLDKDSARYVLVQL